MSTTTLMIHGGSADPHSPVTRVGGLPLAPVGTKWPVCTTCSGPLQFIAQIYLGGGEGGVLAVFMCANDPGSCEEWSATSGGNRAFLFPAEGLVPLGLPELDGEVADSGLDADSGGDAEADSDSEGEEGYEDEDDEEDEDEDEEFLHLGAVRIVELLETADADYREAYLAWSKQTGRSTAEVLGQLGGTPDWLQYEQVPDCPGCARPMAFAAQLKEGPDPVTAPNFGSGQAYAFACEPCAEAAFLWQC
ncbi:hypothetical protein [Streptomyces sp. NPDC089799]|uniref:hypothetical protein n=1 Tax=Streptomyces sp. NPDC089799 TaxID=3155066 RepID=UPI00343A873A